MNPKEKDLVFEQILEITKAVDSVREDIDNHGELIKIARHCPSCRELFKKYLENKDREDGRGRQTSKDKM